MIPGETVISVKRKVGALGEIANGHHAEARQRPRVEVSRLKRLTRLVLNTNNRILRGERKKWCETIKANHL